MKHITIVDPEQYSEDGWDLLVSVCREDDLIIDMNDFFGLLASLTNKDRRELETKLNGLRMDPKSM